MKKVFLAVVSIAALLGVSACGFSIQEDAETYTLEEIKGAKLASLEFSSSPTTTAPVAPTVTPASAEVVLQVVPAPAAAPAVVAETPAPALAPAPASTGPSAPQPLLIAPPSMQVGGLPPGAEPIPGDPAGSYYTKTAEGYCRFHPKMNAGDAQPVPSAEAGAWLRNRANCIPRPRPTA